MGIKISELSASNVANGNDYFYIISDGVSKKITKNNLFLYNNSGTSLSSTDISNAISELDDVVGGLSSTLSNAILEPVNTLQFNSNYTSSTNPPHSEGMMFYDFVNKVMAFYTDKPDVVGQINEESWIRCVNKTGSVLLNGTVVKISGAQGNRPTVVPALATSADYRCVAGICTHDIGINEEGFITILGVVGGLNTSMYSEGMVLYLSTTSAGMFTSAIPNAPHPQIQIGVVLVSHINDGKILLHINSPHSIEDLSDVNGTVPQEGYILGYVSSGGYWDSMPLNNITRESDGIFKTLSAGDVANGNFLEIQSDGSLQLRGNATAFDDLFFPATSIKLGVNFKPDYDYTENGLLFPQNDESERINIIAQFPHRRKTGSVISPHMHFIQSVSAIPKFVMLYRIAELGGQFPTTYTSALSTSGVMPYTSGSIHQLIPFPDIQTSAISGVSSLMDIVIYRQTGDGIAGDVLFKQFDIHIEIDAMGSRALYIK